MFSGLMSAMYDSALVAFDHARATSAAMASTSASSNGPARAKLLLQVRSFDEFQHHVMESILLVDFD